MTDPIEARLAAIEAREAREERIYFPDGRKHQSETAWLVALVRRYRRALVDALSWAEAARTSPTVGAMNASVVEIHRTLREALNEEG